MIDCMTAMHEDFSKEFKLTDTGPPPAADNLFAAGNSKLLDTDRANQFHAFAAKGLFACKQARPDIGPTIAVISTCRF